MSKEVFLLPSAKQILSYENGDIRSDELSIVYRFHFLNAYLWIEPSKNGFDIKIRGRYFSDTDSVFVPNSSVVLSFSDLTSAVSYFKKIVGCYIFLHDFHESESPDFNFGD